MEPAFKVRQAAGRETATARLKPLAAAAPESFAPVAVEPSRGVSKLGLAAIGLLVVALGGLSYLKLKGQDDLAHWDKHTLKRVVLGQSPDQPTPAPAATPAAAVKPRPSWATSPNPTDEFHRPLPKGTAGQPKMISGIQLASHETEDPFAAPQTAPAQTAEPTAPPSEATQALFAAPAAEAPQQMTPAQRARSLAPVMSLDAQADNTSVQPVQHVEADPFAAPAQIPPRQPLVPLSPSHMSQRPAPAQPAASWDLQAEVPGQLPATATGLPPQTPPMAPAATDPFASGAAIPEPRMTDPRPLNIAPMSPPAREMRPAPAAQTADPFFQQELPPTQARPAAAFGEAGPSRNRVPAQAPFSPKEEAPPSEEVYQVQSGDNYWTISRKFYGSARFFSALAEYNKHRIPQPEKMKPGMIVLVPALDVLHQRFPQMTGAAVAQAAESLPAGYFVDAQGPAYRVGEGDTLTTISEKHLGRSSRWTQIYGLNRELIPNKDALKIGTVLRLPADACQVVLAPDDTSIR
ncbi:LysM peptidoglycan-binding domain-containing protein [Planctomicrobium sp. SH664]|uniref:LysM peptidoglycan-binding domain-containing protein n=1 Tax=Planctomicrobium sp. SH664 TaxID=3448125 RepID=UPI003F5B18F7